MSWVQVLQGVNSIHNMLIFITKIILDHTKFFTYNQERNLFFHSVRLNQKSIMRQQLSATTISQSKSNTTAAQGIIDYKNVELLYKFISAEGKILPRRLSGLSAKQQRYVTKAIKNARMVGLLPFVNKQP
jgi:small subunit ribosomal protein S18